MLTCSPAERPPSPAARGSAACEIRLEAFSARVSGPPALLAELRALFPSPPPRWRDAPAADLSATFQVELDAARPGWYRIVGGALPPWEHDDPATLLSTLEAAIHQAAARALGQRYLLFHAAAVARNGRGFILPAPSGRGKSTLVAWLLAYEFAYFSDEVAMLDPASLQLVPFPRSLDIKDGARQALAASYPRLLDAAPCRRLDGQAIWHLAPPPAAVPCETVPVRYVVLPRWLPEGG